MIENDGTISINVQKITGSYLEMSEKELLNKLFDPYMLRIELFIGMNSTRSDLRISRYRWFDQLDNQSSAVHAMINSMIINNGSLAKPRDDVTVSKISRFEFYAI
jgi:hypothetical protein